MLKVKQLASSVSSQLQSLSPREFKQREVDLRNTIDLMNLTMHSLQNQNVNLLRQTQVQYVFNFKAIYVIANMEKLSWCI